MKARSIGPGGTNKDTSRGQNTSRMEKFLSDSLTVPRILVADDDRTTSELLRSIAGGAGYEVVSVADGRETFRLLRIDADFSIAIFNMAMPHVEGVEILKYMKTEKRLMRIPVVVVGGASHIRTVAEVFVAGAVAFLPKPFNAHQLQRTVRLALSARAAHKIQRAA